MTETNKSDDEFMAALGADPAKWALAFVKRFDGECDGIGAPLKEIETRWFANAMKAGRKAQAKEAARWMWRAAALYVNMADPEAVAAIVTSDERGIAHWHLPILPMSEKDALASTLLAADGAAAMDRIDTALDQFKPNLDDPFVRFVVATIHAHYAHRVQPQRFHRMPPLVSDVPMSPVDAVLEAVAGDRARAGDELARLGIDAAVWAKACAEQLAQGQLSAHALEDRLRGWFANAIGNGVNAGMRELEGVLGDRTEELADAQALSLAKNCEAKAWRIRACALLAGDTSVAGRNEHGDLTWYPVDIGTGVWDGSTLSSYVAWAMTTAAVNDGIDVRVAQVQNAIDVDTMNGGAPPTPDEIEALLGGEADEATIAARAKFPALSDLLDAVGS